MRRKLACSALAMVVVLIATACTSTSGTNDSITTPEAWRLELPIPTTNWTGDARILQNGADCASQSGRVVIKDGTGEIIGTGPIERSGTVTGLPDDSKWLSVENARAAGGECLTTEEATVIPLARTAHIYVIIIKEDGNEREMILSSTEVEDLGWLHSD